MVQEPVQNQTQTTTQQPIRKPSLEMPKKPANVQTQPAEKQVQPVLEKKSKWWLWLIIALTIIGVGVGVYFWLF